MLKTCMLYNDTDEIGKLFATKLFDSGVKIKIKDRKDKTKKSTIFRDFAPKPTTHNVLLVFFFRNM